MRGSRFLIGALCSLTGLHLGCDANEPAQEPADPGCEELFGQPSDNTGLGPEQCRPECSCNGESWQAQTFSEAELAALEQATLLDPPAPLGQSPYDDPAAHPHQPDKLCGLLVDPLLPDSYRVQTFASELELQQASAVLTHYGACGRCSSLPDLAVYIRNPDLTGPVRDCAIEGMSDGQERNIECLQEIGFSSLCAEIWYYNSVHTRTACLSECIAALDEPHHLPDGSPNPCIQCDEDRSGPVFKAVSGRTRRNSGLPSALCRPCSTVRPVTHAVVF